MKDDYNEINITGLDEEDEELNDFEIAEDLSSDEHGDEIIIKGLDDEEENNDYEDETDKMTAYEEYEIKEENYNEDNSEEYKEEIEFEEDLNDEQKKELEKAITYAMLVRENAHHNSFKVGAALKMKSGKIYTGCNINNQDIMSICAERVAFAKAISKGENDFEFILIVGGPVDGFLEKCLPCGYCRQFMSEFVDSNFKIYAYYNNKIDKYTIKDLLPEAFEY